MPCHSEYHGAVRSPTRASQPTLGGSAVFAGPQPCHTCDAPSRLLTTHVHVLTYFPLQTDSPLTTSHAQVYDPAKKWDSYTIHGAETFGEGNSSTLSQHGVMRTA